jgi:hypothetical protein
MSDDSDSDLHRHEYAQYDVPGVISAFGNTGAKSVGAGE